MVRTLLIAAVALLTPACTRVGCPVRAAGPSSVVERVFLVVHAQPLPDGEPLPGGTEPEIQILIESSVVAVNTQASAEVLASATRIAFGSVPVWLAGAEGTAAACGPEARVLAQPAILTRSGETATLFVGESGGPGLVPQGTRVTIAPAITPDGASMALTITYEHFRDGRLVRAIPSTSVAVPVGRVVILEALRR